MKDTKNDILYTVEEATNFLELERKKLSNIILRHIWWYPKRYIKDIPRQVNWFFQRVFRGYDDPCIWGLYYSITKFILPRLRFFRNHYKGYPCNLSSEVEWSLILDDMIEAFELIILEEEDSVKFYQNYELNHDKINKGLRLFSDYYLNLWD